MYTQALTIMSLTIMEYYSKLMALLKKLYEHVKVTGKNVAKTTVFYFIVTL